MAGPFEGVRVIDITRVLAGPFAAYQPAMRGADVIKVSNPAVPDQSRSTGTNPAWKEAIADPQLATPGVIRRHNGGPGIEGGFGAPLAAFAHDGPRIDSPPPQLGEHNVEILNELRYNSAEIEQLRSLKVI